MASTFSVSRTDSALVGSSSSKYSNITVRPGDRVHLIAPGGGGWGNPAERDKAMVKEDLAEGYISAKSAEEDYGVKASEG